ncbi:hypothetical protein PILCRDRAFT_816671 [Piloderma croceum F 1598]|uniref:Uncharacterized protein n=1 Tax=Piloderma croceum (strain F 1598) TaxID=765440 RepID=A0A0C3C8Y5_PILCF|nr:hypothetical protein PILCRDRAFT_816671 [Piloderma croceum F 1598]
MPLFQTSVWHYGGYQLHAMNQLPRTSNLKITKEGKKNTRQQICLHITFHAPQQPSYSSPALQPHPYSKSYPDPHNPQIYPKI